MDLLILWTDGFRAWVELVNGFHGMVTWVMNGRQVCSKIGHVSPDEAKTCSERRGWRFSRDRDCLEQLFQIRVA